MPICDILETLEATHTEVGGMGQVAVLVLAWSLARQLPLRPGPR